MKNGVNLGFDFARIVACFMVIILHVAAINFYSFGDNWWATNVYDSLVRCSIPVFLLISGALLLTKEERLGIFMKKRFIRIFPPLIFWSLFYMSWNVYKGVNYGTWSEWIKTIIKGPVVHHFWYLYALVGLYLFIPFLSKIYVNSLHIEKKFYICLWVLFASIWPISHALFQINFNLVNVYSLGSFSGFIGYLFLGAYLYDCHKNIQYSMGWYLSNYFFFFICSALTIFTTSWYSNKLGKPNELFYDYLSPFVLISACCAFNILYGLGLKLDKYSGVIKLLSKNTFGIFCIHVFVINRVQVLTGLSGSVQSSWWSIPVTAIFVFGISLSFIMLIRKISILRYLT
jgi:surface polysaccharide O-acyltransferase-like enzyme